MLDPAQLRAFFDEGFVIVPDLFDAEAVQRMREAFDRLAATAARLGETRLWQGSQFVLEQAETRVKIKRIVWCGAAEPVLAEMGRHPRLVRLAAQLLGSEAMIQIINQAHYKLPGDGVHFPWHQDSTHRRCGTPEWLDVNGRGSYVQTLTALDEMGPDNGPLEFIPGSGAGGHAGLPEGQLPPGVDPARAVAATLEPGSVVLFGPYTFHRSLPNLSTRARRVFINGFAFPGANARVYPGAGVGQALLAG